MKFFKLYREYMQEQQQKGLPVVSFKNFKQMMKKCRVQTTSKIALHHCLNDDCEKNDEFPPDDDDDNNSSICPEQCPVCDGTIFPSLLNEMSVINSCFSERAQGLLDMHLAKGLRRFFLFITGKSRRNHNFLIQECQELFTYAVINAIAVRKILKKYDKIHHSKQGQTFKSQAQSIHIEILQSPWLCELVALHINLREVNAYEKKADGELFKGSSLTFTDEKPALTLELFDTLKLDIDLTCSICLDTVFDAVALKCGHILCYMCACSAASVTIVDGLKRSSRDQRCPLCREAGVYRGAVPMEELNILLSRSCPEYWEKRLQSERAERIRQVEVHWDLKRRAFLGFE